jgi:COP9 signalosome complex subunit 4
MIDLDARLRQVGSEVPSSSKAAAYRTILEDILAQPSSSLDGRALVNALGDFLDQAAFSDASSTGGNLVVGRQVLADFDLTIAKAVARYRKGLCLDDGEDHEMKDSVAEVERPAISDEDTQRRVYEMALEKVQPRVLSFEEQVTSIRQHLADILEDEEDWLEAAKVLQQMPLESGHRSVSDLFKLQTYVRIVRLLLEGDDAVGADSVLKRASLIVHNVPGVMTTGLGSVANNEAQQQALSNLSETERTEAKTLGLQYKLSQARIYDAQRRFAEAANRYHEVSYVVEIDEEERKMMLSAAVTASILAPAGPQRSRMLATLVRDERTASLPQHTILTKTFLDQIIRPNEIKSFEKLLSPHQLAALPKSNDVKSVTVTKTGEDAIMAGEKDALDEEEESTRMGPSTVLDRAMMEHNIIAVSRLYANITLYGLGALLDVHSSGAETLVRRMIGQGRLKATIDQVDGLIVFGEQTARGITVAGASAGGLNQQAGDLEQSQQGADDADAEDATTVYTKRWDSSIASVASGVEEVCARLRGRSLINV